MPDSYQVWTTRPVDFTDQVKIRKQRAPKRPRVEGIVGPEPDWEVIYSDIPFSQLERFFIVGQFSHMEGMFPRNGVYSSKRGCIHTSGMKVAHVLAWTEWAHQIGVQFSGKSGYIFPKGEEVKAVPFKYRIRHLHAADRIGPKAIGQSPIYFGTISSKKLRTEWWKSTTKMSFKEFIKERKTLQPFLHGKKTQGVPLPPIVLKALTGIYTRKAPLPVAFRPKERAVSLAEKRANRADKARAYFQAQLGLEKTKREIVDSIYNVKRTVRNEQFINMNKNHIVKAQAVLRRMSDYYIPFGGYEPTIRTRLQKIHDLQLSLLEDMKQFKRTGKWIANPSVQRDRIKAEIAIFQRDIPLNVEARLDGTILLDGVIANPLLYTTE